MPLWLFEAVPESCSSSAAFKCRLRRIDCSLKPGLRVWTNEGFGWSRRLRQSSAAVRRLLKVGQTASYFSYAFQLQKHAMLYMRVAQAFRRMWN